MLENVFTEQAIKIELKGKTKEEAFDELAGVLTAASTGLDKARVLDAIYDRENKMNTAIASGVAAPHGYYAGLGNITGALGISKQGIDYGASDNKPVHVIFMIVLGDSCREKHLRVLNRVMSLIKSDALDRIRQAKNAQEAYMALAY